MVFRLLETVFPQRIRLGGSVVLLSGLASVHVILQLGHSVSIGDRLGPALVGISSTFGVERGEVLKDPSLLNVAGVVGGLLGVIAITDLLVLRRGQSSRNVRVRSNLSSFELRLRKPENGAAYTEEYRNSKEVSNQRIMKRATKPPRMRE